ncbi:MAG: hypothetical protein U0790_16235 [Isosphaeraceae bacterium]
MNVLILGDGPEELSWLSWFAERPEHQPVAIYPGPAPEDLIGVPVARDLDDALATPGVELVVAGGSLESRGESLRRAAAEGLAIICIHPPGEDSEAYYQVSLSRSETGAVVVPDLPLRLHPGIDRLRRAMARGELGDFRGLRLDRPAAPEDGDLVRGAFARAVDVVRALLGQIETVTAGGDPPGEHPDVELLVQLRAAGGRRAEVRIWAGPDEPVRLTLLGSTGSLTLECEPDYTGKARLLRRLGAASADEQVETLEPWDSHEAILQSLIHTLAEQGDAPAPGASATTPSLLDGTRAMELSEAVTRSLRRGRTIDLHYESITEEATFKSVMTSTGCLLLLGSLLLLPVALAGPPLGILWTIYLAYAIPPVLVLFTGAQILRFGIGRGSRGAVRAPCARNAAEVGEQSAADPMTG